MEAHDAETAALCGIRGVYKGQMVTDGAGVRINRIIGSRYLDVIDPFVLLDEIRSTEPEDYIAGFPTHPHRGIETITYMLHGKFRHRDSRGGGGLLTDGCVQWMTAGKGIQHSEMPEPVEGEACGYQLWLNLPAALKWVEPRYQHLSPDMIPAHKSEGLIVRVISGAYRGIKGPAANHVRSNYFDAEVSGKGAFALELDKGENGMCYVHSGGILITRQGHACEVGPRRLVEFLPGTSAIITAISGTSRFLFMSAAPNREPIVKGGPFVMNTEEEIEQAFEDYRAGRIF